MTYMIRNIFSQKVLFVNTIMRTIVYTVCHLLYFCDLLTFGFSNILQDYFSGTGEPCIISVCQWRNYGEHDNMICVNI